jgi:hypothetical protein
MHLVTKVHATRPMRYITLALFIFLFPKSMTADQLTPRDSRLEFNGASIFDFSLPPPCSRLVQVCSNSKRKHQCRNQSIYLQSNEYKPLLFQPHRPIRLIDNVTRSGTRYDRGGRRGGSDLRTSPSIKTSGEQTKLLQLPLRPV